MKFIDKTKLSADDWDEVTFPRPSEQEFDRVVERAISRRGFLGGVVAFGSGAAVMGAALLKATTGQAQETGRFAFTPIPAATDGTVHVPKGYSWQRMVSWGDPLFAEAEGDFDHETGGSVAMSEKVFGENTNGMWLFNQRWFCFFDQIAAQLRWIRVSYQAVILMGSLWLAWASSGVKMPWVEWSRSAL